MANDIDLGTENTRTGKLEEHEATSQSKKDGTNQGAKGEQTDVDRRIVKMSEDWLTKSKRHRSRYDQNWVSNVKYAEGNQWTEKRPSYRHSEVLNFTWASIQTIIPILTDNRPNIETLPQEPSDFEFAEIMTQILRSKWDRRQFSQILAEGIIDLATYGTVVSRQEWDEDLDFGLGDYEYQTVDPIYCYPDPNGRDVNDSYSQRFQTAVPTDIDCVKRKYPKWAHLIKANVGELPHGFRTSEDIRDDYRVESASDYGKLVQNEKPADSEGSDQVLLVTTYCLSQEVEEYEIEEKDENGGTVKKFQTKKKYPNGRKIVHANGVLLSDEENPYIDGKFPFARGVDYARPRVFWGMGEVEQLRGPQDMINKIISYTMDVLVLMGNPIWIVDTESGVDAGNIINAPGLIIEKNQGSEVRREQGVNLQPFILQTYDRLVQAFEQISGVTEVTRGVSPSSSSSGVAIEMLQEANQTKLRLKSRNVEAWLTQVGQQHVARILQYYSIPRVVRLTGDENSGRFFKIAIDEKVDEENQAKTRVMAMQEFNTDPETGEVIPSDIREIEAKGNLDVIITTGTTLPFAKAQREARADKLFQLGIYDEADYLEDIQHPRADKVLQKLTQRKKAEAEAAQAEFQQQQQAQVEQTQVGQQGQLQIEAAKQQGLGLV